MENPYLINLRAAFITSIAGLALPLFDGRLFSLEFLFFIGGFLMLIMTPALKKENQSVYKLVVVLTFSLAVFAFVMFGLEYNENALHAKNIGRFIIGAVNTAALVNYVQRYIKTTQLKKQNNAADDYNGT